MDQVNRRHRQSIGNLSAAAIVAVVLVDALSLGSCCLDCARLSRIGAASSSGPSSTPTEPNNRSARSSNPTNGWGSNAGSPSAPPKAAAIPAGGEPVGSGFYVNSGGHVLTTWDAIHSCGRIAILDDYELRDAVVVAANRINGLAVLRAASSAKNHAIFRRFPPVVGEDVSVVAYPVVDGLLMSLEVTQGLVRAQMRPYGDEGFLQSSVPAANHSAGGPIVDTRGAVIGIAVSGSDKDWPAGVGYGIGTALILKYLSATGVEIDAQHTDEAGNSTSPPKPALTASAYTVPVICFH